MIDSLYPVFKHWTENGSIYLLGDTHFDCDDCKIIDPNWITPQEQINIINLKVHKNDTFILLGDVGNPKYISAIKAKQKILILGNHDKKNYYNNYFNEVYNGALFIASKILLSHEPINGLEFCLNIHGHNHNNLANDNLHLNLVANLNNYTPINLRNIIENGGISNIKNIHRTTIDKI